MYSMCRQGWRIGSRVLITACAALWGLASGPGRAAAQVRVLTTPRVGAFVPTRTLGPWLTASARTGPGVSLGLTFEIAKREGIAARAEIDAALGSGPWVQSDDCSRSCGRQNTYAAAVALGVADLVIPFRATGHAGVNLLVGGGLKGYLFPAMGSSCAPTDDVCAATLRFTKNQADPTVHVAAALTRPLGRREVMFELGDYASRYDGGRVQHDLLLTLGIRRRAR